MQIAPTKPFQFRKLSYSLVRLVLSNSNRLEWKKPNGNLSTIVFANEYASNSIRNGMVRNSKGSFTNQGKTENASRYAEIAYLRSTKGRTCKADRSKMVFGLIDNELS